MRIGVNGLFLEGRRTGIGRYLECILREWSKIVKGEEIVLYCLSEEPGDSFLSPFSKRKLSLMGENQYDIFDYEFRNFPISVFFSALYDLPYSVRSPAVMTIHDMIHEAFPGSFNEIQLDYLREKTRFSINRADRIITDSQFSRDEIIEYFPGAEEKITVIPLAQSPLFKVKEVAPGFIKKRFGVEAPYILYVGAVTPKRHIKFLLDPYLQLSSDFHDWSVIMVGRNVIYPPEDLSLLVSSHNERVGRRALVYEEFVSDDELLELYNGASIFVYLSAYEGFGMPPLEAMACGVPVITTNLSSLPEVVGNAAIKVDPYDKNEVRQALQLMMENGNVREEYRQKGFAQREKFSWEKTARSTLDIIKSVVK